MNWRSIYKKAVTFSYDDGVEQDVKLLEILNEYGLRATFNLNTGLDYDHGTWKYNDTLWVRRLNLPDAVHLYKGHEIAVHGRQHLNLTELNAEQLHNELVQDAEEIRCLFGTAPVGMAYAYGTYNDAVTEKLRSMGIQYARGVQSSYSFEAQTDLLRFCPTCHHDDAQLFALAEEFLRSEPDTPRIFYIWGHSYEFEGKNNWDRFRRFCEMISGRNDIFYGTNREVLL